MMIVLVIFCGISMLMGCSGEGVFVATNQWQKINEGDNFFNYHCEHQIR